MTHIYYEVPILDDEGNQFAEFDATVHFNIELENGEPLVCVEQFDVDAIAGHNNAIKGKMMKSFSSLDEDVCMRTLFLRGKDALEQDAAFINAALDADDTMVFHGRGVHDPNGHYIKHDPNGHYIKHDPNGYYDRYAPNGHYDRYDPNGHYDRYDPHSSCSTFAPIGCYNQPYSNHDYVKR